MDGCGGHALLTVFVLHHDGVAEREQLEELIGIFVFPGSDAGNQRMVPEVKLFVGLPVPAPVYRLTGVKRKGGNSQ